MPEPKKPTKKLNLPSLKDILDNPKKDFKLKKEFNNKVIDNTNVKYNINNNKKVSTNSPVKSKTATKVVRKVLNTILPEQAAQLLSAVTTQDKKLGLDDLEDDTKQALINSVKNAIKRSGKLEGNTEYLDYGNNASSKFQEMKMTKADMFSSEPNTKAASMVGRVSYKKNKDTGKIDIYDSYDFSKTKPETVDSVYKGVRYLAGEVLSDEDSTSNLIGSIDYQDNNEQMKKTRKKYGYGSSGVGSNYIENPATTIAKGDIMNAEAERKAANNPWIPITLMAGQLASTAISAGAGKSAGKTGATDFTVTGQDTALNIPNEGMSPIQQQFVNAMGNSNAEGNVEVEGKEVIETPTGEVAEVKGASHEEGGVNMNVPEGTKIYSKRIEKFGETMAERKKIRERKLTNLNKLLENSKGDIAVKNAHARSVEALNEQEQADLQTQEMYGVMAAVHEFAFGTDENGVRKYWNGSSGIQGPNPEYGYDVNGKFIKPVITDDWKGIPYDNVPELPDFTGLKPKDDTVSLIDEQVLAPETTSVDEPGTVASRFIDKAGKFVDKSGFKMPGTGDIVSLAGDAISAFSPMKNTLENRAGDTPNINAYKDFGKDALEANLNAMEMSAGQKAEALRKITASANGAKRVGRNSARGINQLRALDLATDINSNEANQGAVDSFQRTMQELLGQKAGLENQQDQMVMAGEQERDLNDRKDRDNFYTQLGKDKSTMGEGVQNIGKDLNAMKSNRYKTNLINKNVSHNGLSLNDKGEITFKGKTKDELTEEEAQEAEFAKMGYVKNEDGTYSKITK